MVCLKIPRSINTCPLPTVQLLLNAHVTAVDVIFLVLRDGHGNLFENVLHRGRHLIHFKGSGFRLPTIIRRKLVAHFLDPHPSAKDVFTGAP